MPPETIDDINRLSDHDILVRLYQKFLDHLQAEHEAKNEFRQRLEDHENRITALEGCQIQEDTVKGLCKHPVVLILVGAALSFMSWFGYKAVCHLVGAKP